MEAKLWAHSKKGQAILELALFGSILILCLGLLIRYGLSINYSQRLQMEAFRQAVKRAYSGRNTFVNASYTILEDKPIPNPADPFGASERSVFGASAGAVWSNQVYAASEYGAISDLPRVDYQINDKRYTFTTGAFKDVSYNGQTLWKKDDNDNWEQIVCTEQTTYDDVLDEEITSGWVCDTFRTDLEQQGVLYAHVDGVDDDRDGDGDCDVWERREEMVIGLTTTTGSETEGDGEGSSTYNYTFITGIQCIDFQDGQIDTEKVAEYEQGISGYTTHRSSAAASSPSASLTKVETTGAITTTATLNAKDKITRKIKTNIGITAEGELPESPLVITTPSGLTRSISFSPSEKEVYVEDTFTKQKTATWQTDW